MTVQNDNLTIQRVSSIIGTMLLILLALVTIWYKVAVTNPEPGLVCTKPATLVNADGYTYCDHGDNYGYRRTP